MPVICPWCQTPVPVPDGTPTPAVCPACGRQLVSNLPTTERDLKARTGPPPIPGEAPPVPAAGPRPLGRYRILASLGAGGFGVVYKGPDEELCRDVAIKVPHRHRLVAPEDAQAYLTEARVLARLDHPAIVPV